MGLTIRERKASEKRVTLSALEKTFQKLLFSIISIIISDYLTLTVGV